MKARFRVAAIFDTGKEHRQRYFLTQHSPEPPDDEGDSAVEELLYDVQAEAIPADFDFPDAKTDSVVRDDGIWVRGEADLKVGDIVDLDITVVGRAWVTS